jgi:uncharacterized protein (UPF0303 family)
MSAASSPNALNRNAEDRAHIDMQEQQLVFPSFDAHTAWSLGSRLRAMAVERGHSLVIDIRRFGSPAQQLFFAALPGTTPDNARWVQRKSNVVARFHRSSYSVGLHLASQSTTINAKYALPEEDYATHGGAFPLSVVGAGIIGSITVSGLPQRADHELVVEAICLELKRDYETIRLPIG